MKKNVQIVESFKLLRKKAITILEKNPPSSEFPDSEADVLKLIHELEVHQIELELQNEELKQSKAREAELATEKYVALYDFAPSGYFTLSGKGEILQLNLRGAKMLGKDRSQLCDRLLQHYISEDTKPVFQEFLRNVFHNKVIGNCEVTFLTDTNIPMYVYLTGIVAENADQCFITSTDLTERKLADKSLLESEERYRSLIGNLEAGIVIHAPDTSILMNNDRASELLGLSNDQLKGKIAIDPAWKFVNEDKTDLSLEDYPVNRIATYRLPIKNQIFGILQPGKSDMVWASVNGFPIFNNSGDITEIVISFIDVTKRKNAEEILTENEEKFRLLYTAMDQGLALHEIITDENGNPVDYVFLDINNSYTKLLGVTREMSIGKRIREVMPKVEQYWIDVFGKVALTGESCYYENYLETTGKYYSTYSYSPKKNQFAVLVTDISERKQFQIALQESQNRLNEAHKLAHIGIWNWDAKTDKVIWSEELFQIAGLDLEHFAPTYAEQSSIYAPQSWLKLQTAVDITMKTGTEYQLELDIIRPDGKVRKVNVFGGAKYDSEGQITGLLGTVQDITERKLSEAIFRDIVEKNPMSIQILNMEGYAIQTNSAHTRLFGVKPPSDYSVLKDQQLLSLGFGELFEQIKKGEVVYFPDSYYNVREVDSSFPDSPVWVKAVGFTLNDHNGKPERIVIMYENITERKHAEALLNDIIEKNPMSIQIVDKKGCILQGNPAYYKLFGAIPPQDFSIFDDLQNKSKELDLLIKRAKSGEVVHLPDIYFNPHDEVPEAPDNPLWIRALIFPLNDSSGKSQRFVLMHENITENKLFEQELIKAKEHAEESDRLKSAFLANMSHEIRTPMNGILGFAELLKEADLTSEQQSHYIEIIEKSGARMLNIINDIVDISKIESGQMNVEVVEVFVNELIENIYLFFKPETEAKGLQISFRNTLPAKKAVINSDQEKIYAILTNLVKNAIKFTKTGRIELGYEKIDNNLLFFVKDTGRGIRPEQIKMVFERFRQGSELLSRDYEGSGLGLSISKAYVEMLGGKIWVESKVHNPSEAEVGGSTFYFTLPYSAPSVSESLNVQDNSSTIKPIKLRKLKILIAEDDEGSEMFLSALLRSFSNEILTTKTGTDAVEICRNNPDLDLILMDIKMLEMDGYQATSLIRQFNKDVIIIAQTAFAQNGTRELAIESGCTDYISKPIRRDKLMELLHQYFGN